MKLSDQQIKDISDYSNSGMKCYVNLDTWEFDYMPDFDHFGVYGETEGWDEVIAKVDGWDNHIVIEGMSSRDSFKIMERFLPKVKKTKLRNRLAHALEKRKPFRHFKDIVEYEETREAWFEHRDQQQIEFTKEQIRMAIAIKTVGYYEHPAEPEEAAQEEGINLTGVSFRLQSNTAEGAVDSTTVLYFWQNDNVVSAEYEGMNVEDGHIVGHINGDEVKLLYHCIVGKQELKAGQATGKITRTEDNRMQLELQWQWLTGDKASGTSVYLEEV